MARVAIGIPAFNEERFISSTLKSALRQFKHCSDLEIFVSDNCSEDNTVLEIEKVIENTKVANGSINVFKNSLNDEAAANFWRVFDSSDSEFFMWLGAHDRISDQYVSLGIEHLLQNPQTSMFCGRHRGITQNNEIINKDVSYNFNHKNAIQRYLDSILQLANGYIFHSIFKRDTLDGYLRKQTPSADHIIISRWLWNGTLYQSKQCAYFRRYFTQDKRQQKTLQGDYVNNQNNLEFFDAYLTDLDILSSALPYSIRTAVNQLASQSLLKRFGIPFITAV